MPDKNKRSTNTKPAKKIARRRRGRPPKADSPIATGPVVSRAVIIERAIKLTETIPLAELSIVRLAKDLGVAPGLIHYYVGGRDKLITGVLNNYYRKRMAGLPPLTGGWRADVEAISKCSFQVAIENPGISLYVAARNKYRLFQDVGAGETDYGMAYFDYIASAFRQGKFSATQVALAYHLLALYLVSSGMAEAGKQLPAYHQRFILKKLQTSPEKYAAAHSISESFASLDSEATFEAGLKILLDGFNSWLVTTTQHI